MRKSYTLIIDGNLFARKMFYKFKALKTKIAIKNLGIISPKLRDSIADQKFGITERLQNPLRVFNPKTGEVLNVVSNARIDDKIIRTTALNSEVEINTGVAYGILRSLMSICKENLIGKIIFCFDPVSHNREVQYRSILEKGYKASRMDSDSEKQAENFLFYEQLGISHYLLWFMGIEQVWTINYEADDIIHHYAIKFGKNPCLILSNDHDLFQLITNTTSILLRTKEEQVLTLEKFKARYGINPDRYLDVMCLCGCGGDEVAGLPNVGEKTAISLIKTAKNLKNLLRSYSKIPMNKKVLTALDDDKANAFATIKHTYRLVKLYGKDPKLKDQLVTKKQEYSDANYDRLILILKLLKFKSLLGDPGTAILKEIMINQK